MPSPLTRLVVLSLVAALAVGCSKKDPNAPELLGVDGVVTLDGQPLEGAVVCFHPIGIAREPRHSAGRMPAATTRWSRAALAKGRRWASTV